MSLDPENMHKLVRRHKRRAFCGDERIAQMGRRVPGAAGTTHPDPPNASRFRMHSDSDTSTSGTMRALATEKWFVCHR